MRQNQKGSAMIVVLCVLSVVIILGLSMAAISGSSRSATVKNQHNQQAYYTARSVLDGVVLMLQTNGNADNIANGLGKKLGENKTLTAKGDLKGMGSYTVTMTLTDDVEYITVLEPDLDADGKQKTNEEGKLLYKEKEVVSRLPLKITVQSQYKDSAAMVSAYIDGTPVLGDAPAGGTDSDPEKPDKVPGGVDPVIQGLFPYVTGMAGTIGSMIGVTIEGAMYAAGGIGPLDNCQVTGNIYTAVLSTRGGKIEGNIYTRGPLDPFTTTIITGEHEMVISLPDPPPGTLGSWKPPTTPSSLDTTIDATKGPVYLTADSPEISNLQIKGDYPVYIQVTGSSLSIDPKNITGASNTQVFYLCDDSVKEVSIGHSMGGGDFYGYVYAPKANIVINKNITVTGALTGSTLNVNSKGISDKITIIYQEPVGKHPDDIFPLPDDGDDGSGGSGGGDDGDDDGKDDPIKPDDKPDDTTDKVVERYEWPVTGYQGGAV